MFEQKTIDAIVAIAKREEIPPAALLAVVQVESGGRVYTRVNGKQLPLIRWEGHYFYRQLPPEKRRIAVDAGLASSRAGAIKNPRKQAHRYALLRKAKRIDHDAALESCSWGAGQVMGAHWKSLGYKSPEHMVGVATAGISGQVDIMMKFILKNNLVQFIRTLNWAAFARRYNGPNYAKYEYDIRLEKAYEYWFRLLN